MSVADGPEPAVWQPGRVSVIIPTRNVERSLEACLRSIREQDYGDVEVVVVDNASTDATWLIAQEYADVCERAGPERSAQRNRGTALCTGEFVLWIDSDMILPPPTVRRAVEAAQSSGADAVSLPEISVGPGYWTACRALERSCYLDDPGLFNPRLLRRSLVEAIGGFDETMAGPEDADLRHRIAAHGARTDHVADAFILHDEGRLTLRSIIRKRVYYGMSLPAFAAANPDALRAQGSSTLHAFLRHRNRLLKHPALATGIVVMRTCEAAAYGYGYSRGRRESSHG